MGRRIAIEEGSEIGASFKLLSSTLFLFHIVMDGSPTEFSRCWVEIRTLKTLFSRDLENTESWHIRTGNTLEGGNKKAPTSATIFVQLLRLLVDEEPPTLQVAIFTQSGLSSEYILKCSKLNLVVSSLWP